MLFLPVNHRRCKWKRRYSCKHINHQRLAAKQENAYWFRERRNVTICIEILCQIAQVMVNFSRSIFHLQCMPALSSNIHTWLIWWTCQYIPVSLWGSIRGSDLAAAPCINNCMNITMFSAHTVLCHPKLGEGGSVAILLCLSCKLAAFMIGYRGGPMKAFAQRTHGSKCNHKRSSAQCCFYVWWLLTCLVSIATVEFSESN